MSPPRVRPAQPDDVATLIDLEAAVFGRDAWSPNLVTEGIDPGLPTVAWFVAVDEDQVIGYAVTSVVDVDAELQRIAVEPDRRRAGVAAALLAGVREHAAAGGAERLLLEVREDNMSARLFYGRHGFTELGRRARYYRDGVDALVLSVALGGATPEA